MRASTALNRQILSQQRNGRPSFWERPSRALPDRKGPPWDEQLGSVVWSAVNATGGQIRDSPPHQCRPATGPLLVFDGTGATPAKAQTAWATPRFVVGRVMAWIDYIQPRPVRTDEAVKTPIFGFSLL